MSLIYEAGTSRSDLRKIEGGVNTGAGAYVSAWVSESYSIRTPTTSRGFLRRWETISQGWFCARRYTDGGSALQTVSPLLALVDANDNEVIRLMGNAGSVYLEYNDGSWNTVGSGWTYVQTTGTNQHIAIEFDLSVSGTVAFYVEGVEISRYDGDLSGLSGISSAYLGKWNTGTLGDGTSWSEWICSQENGLNKRFYCKPPTSNGTETDWTGSYTDIDEIGVSATDGISTTSSGDISTFKGAARTFASPYAIDAMVIPFYSRKSNGSPTKIIPQAVVGGVTYDVGDPIPQSYGYRGYAALVHENPATGVAWSLSEANSASLEFGFRSDT